MSIIIDTLKAVRKLLENEQNWTQGVMARDGADRQVTVGAPDACKFCLTGAVRRVLGRRTCKQLDTTMTVLDRLDDAISHAKPGVSIPVFNDSSTHAEVLAVIDAAIKQEEENVNKE